MKFSLSLTTRALPLFDTEQVFRYNAEPSNKQLLESFKKITGFNILLKNYGVSVLVK